MWCRRDGEPLRPVGGPDTESDADGAGQSGVGVWDRHRGRGRGAGLRRRFQRVAVWRSGTGHTMTAQATAKSAKPLGVASAELTAAITKSRSAGAGVDLVETLPSELPLTQAKPAAALKTTGADGP